MDNFYFFISLMNSKKNKLQAEKIGRFICSFSTTCSYNKIKACTTFRNAGFLGSPTTIFLLSQ